MQPLLSCHRPPTHRQGHAGGADIKADDEGRIGFETYMAELTRKQDELVKRTEANQKWIVSPGCTRLNPVVTQLSSNRAQLPHPGRMWKACDLWCRLSHAGQQGA